MSKKKVIILVVILVLIAAPVVYVKAKKKTAAVTYKTSQVIKGTLIATVSGSGNVVVNDSAKVNPSISGTVANLNLKLGDKVTKGQQLFTISNDQLDIAVQKANTNYTQAQQALVTAQASLATAKVTYAGQTGSAGTAKAQAALEQAKLILVQSQNQLEQDKEMLAKEKSENVTIPGTHSASDLAVLQQKIVVDNSTISANTAAVATAQTTVNNVKAGTDPSVKTAKAQLNASETNVEVAKQNVASSLADLNNQKDTAAERTVTAPIDGTVTTISVTNGDTLGSSSNSSNGSSATTTTPIMIQNLDTLKAVIQVNEVDIASVAVGQKASMTFDAVNSLTLTGKVEKVDTVGTASQGVVTYSATVGFDALDAKVRPEMSVNAIVTTEVKQDVLSVPSTAVKSQSDGSNYVQVMENGVPRNQTVTTGVSSDTATEIVSGLTEGQDVVTQTITATSSSTSTINSRSGGGNGGTRIFEGPGGFGG